MNDRRALQIGVALVMSTFSFGLISCQSSSKAQGPGGFPPAAVSVVEVQPQDVPLYAEYAAQTFARDQVDVRGRVDGFIEKRLFQIGSDVRKGQVLYTLDLRPYTADVRRRKAMSRKARRTSSLHRSR